MFLLTKILVNRAVCELVVWATEWLENSLRAGSTETGQDRLGSTQCGAQARAANTRKPGVQPLPSPEPMPISRVCTGLMWSDAPR